MKTKTETVRLCGADWPSLDALIEKLNEIRASTNHDISVSVQGSLNFGYVILCSWERPLTDEELAKAEEYKARCEELERQRRKQQYNKLKVEFGND